MTEQGQHPTSSIVTPALCRGPPGRIRCARGWI